MKKILSTILALALLVSLVPAVFAAGETAQSATTVRTHEYVIGLSAFNTADLTSASAANSSAPVLQNGTALWHQASMAWDAVVDGANTESGNAIDPFMNLNATDKWAFAGTNMTRLGNGGVKLTNNYLQTQVGNGTFSGSYVYTAFKVYVEAPGTYTLQASSIDIAGDSGVMKPKVYFFKEGEATVSTPNRYPSDALVDYFMTNDDGAYETIGEVTVDAAGTYIVSFVGATASDTTTYPTSGSGKYYNLAISGIKLLADEVSAISLSANDTDITEGKTTALTVSAIYTLSGETAVANADVDFTVAPAGIASVSADGTVTALAAGKAVVTATYGGKSASVEITVKSSAVQRTHEYVIGLSAFNTSDLKTVSGFYDGKLYNQASMAWDAVIDGANTESGNAIDPFMNLNATDKWAFAGTNFSRSTPFLSASYLQTQVGNGTFSGSYVYTAFKVYVEAPGTYTLQASSIEVAGDSGVMKPKVYFFKEGEATVSTPNRYPSTALVDYFDTADDGEYDVVGEINVPTAGEYIVSFVGTPGDTTTYPVSGSGKWYTLAIAGIKLAIEEEEPPVPENPNAEITGDDVSIAVTAIANGAVSADAKTLISCDNGIVAGNINSVAIGTQVTLTATETDDYTFLYWYNASSGKILSDAEEYSFVAGTNIPVYAKYLANGEELTEYADATGKLVDAEDIKVMPEKPYKKAGYTLYVDDTAVANAEEASVTNASAVYWTKGDKIVSYNTTYTYLKWGNIAEPVAVTEGTKSDVPAVVLFESNGAYMLELVNFEGIEIIEKGIAFDGDITSCYEKAVSTTDATQFIATGEGEATAYVIYRDGAAIRVAYSD